MDKLLALKGLMILVQMTGSTSAQNQGNTTNKLDLNKFKSKFFQLCNVTVQRINLPERKNSLNLTISRVPFYDESYTIRALAVAYDLTVKEEYLNTIKTRADRMTTNQEKMVLKGEYYMNYGCTLPFRRLTVLP